MDLDISPDAELDCAGLYCLTHLPSENELAAARFQGKYVAIITSKLTGYRRDT